MYIGAGILLLLIGLVIVFAYNGDMSIAGLDIGAIGWIAIVLGVLAIILSLIVDRRRRETIVRDDRRL
jgi:tetrahydromethanopterin S-methyltransferase subunit E